MSSSTRLLAVLVVASWMLTGCTDQSQRDETVEFNSEEAGFRAEFPSEPERSSRSLAAGQLSLDLVAFAAEVEAESVSVAYVDYPPEVNEGPPEDLLNSVADSAALSIGGTVEDREILEYRGQPAIDFQIVSSDGAVQGRALFVGDRLYLLQVARTEAGETESDNFELLTDSFQLI